MRRSTERILTTHVGSLPFIEGSVDAARGDEPEGLRRAVQDVVQPAWGWCAAGCHLNRDTESHIREAGFEITSIKHGRLAPPMPMIRGVAVRP